MWTSRNYTEEWNGATWVEVANLSTARGNGRNVGADANSTAGLAYGGEGPPVSQPQQKSGVLAQM